jgi:hypothetical protein
LAQSERRGSVNGGEISGQRGGAVSHVKCTTEGGFRWTLFHEEFSGCNAPFPIGCRRHASKSAVHARGHFPTDEAAMKLLFLVLNRSEKEWQMGLREWVMARAQFAVIVGERFTRAMRPGVQTAAQTRNS